MINVGIIGLGFMAATHLKAYRQLEGVRVAALCNPSGRHLDGDFSQVAGNVGSKDPLKLDMTGVKATKVFRFFNSDSSMCFTAVSVAVSSGRSNPGTARPRFHCNEITAAALAMVNEDNY